jgi:hypothetical protein
VLIHAAALGRRSHEVLQNEVIFHIMKTGSNPNQGIKVTHFE